MKLSVNYEDGKVELGNICVDLGELKTYLLLHHQSIVYKRYVGRGRFDWQSIIEDATKSGLIKFWILSNYHEQKNEAGSEDHRD
jgi:hypothetical protein